MLGEGEERATISKLNLVDLAGSERTKKTGVTGQALKVSQGVHCSCVTNLRVRRKSSNSSMCTITQCLSSVTF